MKLLIPFFLLLQFTIFGQSGTTPKDFKKLKLELDGIETFALEGNVMIKNGHEEKEKVFFKFSVPSNIWTKLLDKTKTDNYKTFSFIAMMISLKAQYSIKNTQSFKPLKSQFIMWDDERKEFVSDYKLMARNGYGNLIETSIIVYYDPFKE